MSTMLRILGLALLTSSAWATPPLAVRDGAFVTPDGQAVGLFGANLYQCHMMWARLQDPAPGLADLRRFAELGFNCARMPLSAGVLMPAPGVLPDDADYATVLQQHGLKAGYVTLLDALVAEADKLGIYLLPEIHEYPRDPYRWFTGGDEKLRNTGQPGGGIDWMADDAAIRRYTPTILQWLAEHWRGRSNIAGFEVPYNEPRSSEAWGSGEGYKQFVAECCAAIKAADPLRLTFMNVLDWGAGVNSLEAVSVWDLPDQVDALAPHFYLGMHSNQATIEGAYGTAPTSWLSWYRGAGKPIVVGEFGPAHAKFPEFQKYDSSDKVIERLHDACLAGWYLNGAQGALRWAWDGGLDDPEKSGQVAGGAAAMLKYGPSYIQKPRSGRGAVAIVLATSKRAQYAGDRDLMRLAAALLDRGVGPFDCLFADHVAAHPNLVSQYRAVLVYLPDLAPEVAARVQREAMRAFPLPSADDEALAGLTDFLAAARLEPLARPQPVQVFPTPGGLAVYNRTAESAAYRHPVWDWERLGDPSTGEVLTAQDGQIRIDVPAFAGRALSFLKPGETMPARDRVDSRTRAEKLPLVLPLYDHGSSRGRWVDSLSGARSNLARSETGLEVLRIQTSGRLQAGGFRFDAHQPVDLLPWLAKPGAALELKLRLLTRGTAAIEVELSGDDQSAAAALSVSPIQDWQLVRVPLDRLRPEGRPETATALYLRFLPEGSGELGSVWLSRPIEP